jgi:hypothetical protein
MIAFLGTFRRLFFLALGPKRIVLSKNALLKKENSIVLRRAGKKRVHFNTTRSGEQQQIPIPGEPGKTGGAVGMSAVLGGLHRYYYRQAA